MVGLKDTNSASSVKMSEKSHKRTLFAGGMGDFVTNSCARKDDNGRVPQDSRSHSRLSPEQYRVTQQSGTEHPGTGEYLDNKEPGIYVDIVLGEPLFAKSDNMSRDAVGQVSTKPIEPANVNELRDTTHGMTRTEVRSTYGDSHLGHVFPDGPTDRGGLRYCITRPRCDLSIAMTWKPKATVPIWIRWNISADL